MKKEQELVERIRQYFNKAAGLEAKTEIDDGTVSVYTSLHFNAIDRDATVGVVINEANSILVYIDFGKVKESLNTYRLINSFHIQQAIYKAFINEDGSLELQYFELEAGDTDQVLYALNFVLCRLFEEPYESLLKAILA